MTDADTRYQAEQQALGQLAGMDLALTMRLHALAMRSLAPEGALAADGMRADEAFGGTGVDL